MSWKVSKDSTVLPERSRRAVSNSVFFYIWLVCLEILPNFKGYLGWNILFYTPKVAQFLQLICSRYRQKCSLNSQLIHIFFEIGKPIKSRWDLVAGSKHKLLFQASVSLIRPLDYFMNQEKRECHRHYYTFWFTLIFYVSIKLTA